jgi:TolB protein
VACTVEHVGLRVRLAAAVAACVVAAGASPGSATLGVGHQLFAVNADGTGRRSLSDGVHADRSIAVSRTGRIAFVREARPAPVVDADVAGIWTARLDGTDARRVVAVPVGCAFCVVRPLWSPDGRRLAFVRTGPTSEAGLWIVNADATGLRRLSSEATSVYGERDLSWSPDGRWIAYQYADPAACGPGAYTNCSEWSVRLIASTGGSVRVLARRASDPLFSPDGRRVAYRRIEGGESLGLYLVGRDGQASRRVWPKRALSNFKWTPRGDRLVFTWRNGLYSIRPDGRLLRRLGAPAFQLEWAPRGDRAAYVSVDAGPPEVWTMRANGSGRRRVATTDGYHPPDSLGWSPDGRTIFFTG